MRAITSPDDYENRQLVGMVLAMPSETKRPIGFARDWPEDKPSKKKRKKAKR